MMNLTVCVFRSSIPVQKTTGLLRNIHVYNSSFTVFCHELIVGDARTTNSEGLVNLVPPLTMCGSDSLRRIFIPDINSYRSLLTITSSLKKVLAFMKEQ